MVSAKLGLRFWRSFHNGIIRMFAVLSIACKEHPLLLSPDSIMIATHPDNRVIARSLALERIDRQNRLAISQIGEWLYLITESDMDVV